MTLKCARFVVYSTGVLRIRVLNLPLHLIESQQEEGVQ
jgi:hypothetical protein